MFNGGGGVSLKVGHENKSRGGSKGLTKLDPEKHTEVCLDENQDPNLILDRHVALGNELGFTNLISLNSFPPNIKNKLLKENLLTGNKVGGSDELERSIPIDLAVEEMVRNIGAEVSSSGRMLGDNSTHDQGILEAPVGIEFDIVEALEADGESDEMEGCSD